MEKSVDAYRTISEVADGLKLPQHVLRFWETRFPQVKPMKRGGGRRFYRPEDVDLLRAIQSLLYGEGYTIKGVQRILKEQGPRAVAALAARGAKAGPERRAENPPTRDVSSGNGPGSSDRVIDGPVASPDAHAAATANGAAASSGGDGVGQVDRLQAVLLDLAECGRLLAAARG